MVNMVRYKPGHGIVLLLLFYLLGYLFNSLIYVYICFCFFLYRVEKQAGQQESAEQQVDHTKGAPGLEQYGTTDKIGGTNL